MPTVYRLKSEISACLKGPCTIGVFHAILGSHKKHNMENHETERADRTQTPYLCNNMGTCFILLVLKFHKTALHSPQSNKKRELNRIKLGTLFYAAS